jgi:hypothetical protein
MRQNFGLFFLTAGSVILSICVFPRRFIASWKDVKWEQRPFLKMVGNSAMFGDRTKNIEYENRMLSDAEFRKREMKHAERRERIITDLPIIALLMMLIGFFLVLKLLSILRRCGGAGGY